MVVRWFQYGSGSQLPDCFQISYAFHHRRFEQDHLRTEMLAIEGKIIQLSQEIQLLCLFKDLNEPNLLKHVVLDSD